MKDEWKEGGATLIHHTKSNVTQPPIRTFRPPSGIDLSTFYGVVSFGDSMMQTFVRSQTENMPYHRGNIAWHWNPNMKLSSDCLSGLLEKLESWHGNEHLNIPNVALLWGHQPGISLSRTQILETILTRADVLFSTCKISIPT
jgi:hypothetical protein